MLKFLLCTQGCVYLAFGTPTATKSCFPCAQSLLSCVWGACLSDASVCHPLKRLCHVFGAHVCRMLMFVMHPTEPLIQNPFLITHNNILVCNSFFVMCLGRNLFASSVFHAPNSFYQLLGHICSVVGY